MSTANSIHILIIIFSIIIAIQIWIMNKSNFLLDSVSFDTWHSFCRYLVSVVSKFTIKTNTSMNAFLYCVIYRCMCDNTLILISFENYKFVIWIIGDLTSTRTVFPWRKFIFCYNSFHNSLIKRACVHFPWSV